MQAIGYGSATAWIFPAIIDTAVAVSTMMLVALGDKPARRARTVTTLANTQASMARRWAQPSLPGVKGEVTPVAPASGQAQTCTAVWHLRSGTTWRICRALKRF